MSAKQRRYRTEAEKRRIVEAAREPEASVSVVARRFGVNANLVFKWLKDPRYGGTPDGAAFLPVQVAPPTAEPDPGSADRTPLPPPPILEHRSGIIEIDLSCGSRVRVDAHVNDRVLARVLRILRAAG
jgi:transposase